MKTLIVAQLFVTVLCAAQTKVEVRVPMDDGVTLDATYFIPTTPPPPRGYPTIIFIHGFAMSKAETEPSALVYARMGYFTFTYSIRGHGNSGGLSSIMSDRERKDLDLIVTYVRSLPQVDNRSVGITGGSQGGLHGLWAAADKLPVQAITADVIGPRWASDMLANGCYRSTLMYLISASTVRFGPIRDTLYNDLLDDNYDKFYQDFVPSRDISTTQFESARTPLMLFGKWQDHYFRANEGINAYSTYRAHKDAEKLYLGTGGHYSDDDPAQWNYQFTWITAWFDTLLRRQPSNILREPDITYAYSSLPMDTNGYFTWTDRTLPSWPPSGIQPLRLYLTQSGGLRGTNPTVPTASRTLLNDYVDSTYTFYWAFWDDFQGEWFDASFHKDSLMFQSQPLQSDVDWIGVPKMHLYATPDVEKFPLNAQIYEVDPSGNEYFVNRINFVGRNCTPGVPLVIDADGNAHAHQFKAGNSIRVELTNLDITNRKLLGFYPFVVPVFKRGEVQIMMDSSHPSYIELPTLAGQITSYDMPPVSGTPLRYSLEQNYPNPFNPSTTLSFVISQRSFVSLRVFDILGREVGLLVEGVEEAGHKSVKWEANGLPSGIYFCRMQARPIEGGQSGAFTETRKLLLLR